MQDITELARERDALDKQISDLKTAEVRQRIDDLKAQNRDLTRKITDERNTGKLIEPKIDEEIKSLKAEIEKLRLDRDSYLHRVSNYENEQRNISFQIAEQDAKLKQLVESV